MADFGATDLDAFRTDVREQLMAMYPAELRENRTNSDPEAVWAGRAFAGSSDPQIIWMNRMAAKGWTTPTWPREYGGGGMSAEEGRIF